ncbi:MAG: TlpA disulfide reductase family protein [Desulfuromonadaceae bacterium]|nr:TlpA disulfide reductase family protein [Desulfuromonadaceae bacterium]
MRRACGILFCCLCLLMGTGVIPAFAVKINTSAPDFTLNDLHGNKVRLANYRGKVVILNFWSTTCGPCLAEIPSLVNLQREFKDQGLVVLGIALDPAVKPVQDTVAKLGIEYTNLMDSDKDVYFDSYGLFGQPISIIVDRNGVVRERIIGGVEWTCPQMKNKLQSYLKGR